MVAQTHANEQDDTREKLLAAAHRQFAERGFYGASIAQIAGEVGLTKQALLYHFKRKEDLYSEVLKRISVRLLSAAEDASTKDATPEQRFEAMILAIFERAMDYGSDAKVLLRELLDNQRSVTEPEEWFFRNFLNYLVDALDKAQGQVERPFAEKISSIYMLMSSIQYFTASRALLQRFYGEEEYARICEAYAGDMRILIRQVLAKRAQ